MADIEDFDLDKTTKQAWDEFTERLADVLSVMDASADLTISAVNGEETQLVMYWPVEESLQHGTYSLRIFADGNLIGSATFSL